MLCLLAQFVAELGVVLLTVSIVKAACFLVRKININEVRKQIGHGPIWKKAGNPCKIRLPATK